MQIEVLGAGAFGLSAALALASRGHDVMVADPRGVGGGTTGKGAGIVSTMTWNDDDFHLIQRTRGRLGELIAEAAAEGLPEARLWRSHDSITIAAGDGLRLLDDVQHRIERLGEETERLDATAAAAQWPALRMAPDEEVLVAQEDGFVEAGDLATLLAWTASEAGARIGTARHAESAAANQVGHDPAAPSTTGRDAVKHDERKPDATVLACGPWTSAALAARGARLPLAAFRTQAASLAMEDAHEVPILHDTVHGFYVRPESSASLLAGDGTVLEPHDPDDYDEAADTTFRDSIAQRIVARLAHGGAARLRRGWAGLCVGTPDRHPVCGRVPGHDDLYVLAGDNGFGIMRCLALGERLADAVDGQEADATSPERFAAFSGTWQLREGFGW